MNEKKPWQCHYYNLQIIRNQKLSREIVETPFSSHIFVLTFYTGIEYVGYGVGIYAIGCIIGGFGLGKLSTYAPRWTIVLFDFILEMGAIAMLWLYGEVL